MSTTKIFGSAVRTLNLGKASADSVACYDSSHMSSQDVCDGIAEKLEGLIESAVRNKSKWQEQHLRCIFLLSYLLN